MTTEPTNLRRIRYGPFGDDCEEWFVLCDPPMPWASRTYPSAICIHSTAKDWEHRVGQTFGVPRADIPEDDDVPDHVWAALARYRLLGGPNNGEG
jgi:hypothetical protein